MIPARGVTIVVALVVAGVAQRASAQSIEFHVPRQAATSGIPEFARQARVQIVSPAGIDGQKTQAVNGRYTVDDGLRILLRGTNLYVAARHGNAISLAARPQVVGRPPQKPELVRNAPAVVRPPVKAESEAVPEPPPEIIVSGTKLRMSPSPQAEKTAQVASVTSVGTEELTKRTDTSVVAALERLPGIVRQRGTFTAQAWYPAIRGFQGMYNSVSIDGGMLYLSTRNQRGVPLDFIPTAAANQLVVYRTVTPEIDPNSIGGHIDVRTLRAFDNDAQPLTMLDAQGIFYSRPGTLNNANPSYAINGIVKRTFGPDGNFGFVLAGSAHNDQYNERTNQSLGFVQRDGIDIPSGNLQAGDFTSRAHGTVVMGKLEGRGDHWYGYVAGNYFHENITRVLSRSNVSIIPTSVTNAADGSGTFTGATASALAQVFFNKRKVYSIRGGLEYQTDDRSKIIVNASYLNADYHEGFWTGGSFAVPNVSGTYNVTDRSVATSISSAVDLNDPRQWVQAAGAVASQTEWPLPTEIVTARLEYKSNNFDFSRGLGFDVGVDYRQMWRHLNQYTENTTLPPGVTLNLSQVLDDRSRFNGADPRQPIFVDTDRYFNLVGSLGTTTTIVDPTANYKLNELVIAPFGALYYTTDKFRILAGLRYNITHFANSVSTLTNGVPVPLHNVKTYPYLLPNIQGYYDLGSGLRIRAAYTETTALQNYSDFATGTTTNVDAKLNPFIQGANPNLKPRKSYNEDLSLEWYAPKGYVSLGLFHKRMINEAASVRQEDYDANGILISVIQQPVNAGSANVWGIEIESQWRDLTGISPLLRGVMVDLNGAWFDSETKLLVSQGVIRTISGFRQQPKWVANLILTYENGPFSATLAGQARGRALLGIAITPAQDTYIAPFSSLDAKLGYTLSHNLKFYIEGRNLTNPWYREVTGIRADKVSTAIKGSRIFLVGARMAF